MTGSIPDDPPTLPSTPRAKLSSRPRMTLVAATARPGNWLDTDAPLSDAVLAEVASHGYEGIFRYVPLPRNSSILDISPGELARICATVCPDGKKLQCGLIQHPRSPANNKLTQHDPGIDALTAADAALAAGYPAGCHLALDFEGLLGTEGVPFTSNTTQVCGQWAADWQAVILEAGLRAMLYVGYDVPLDPTDLYRLPGFDSYWSDGGHRKVATRGCALMQGPPVTIHGVGFDRNVMAPDLLGELPWVCQAA
jgi:hypothetical protein